MMVCNSIFQWLPDKAEKDGSYSLPEYLTVTDLAKTLLIHRVTVSKIMHALCLDGTLKKENGIWYVTDLDKLDKYRLGILSLPVSQGKNKK